MVRLNSSPPAITSYRKLFLFLILSLILIFILITSIVLPQSQQFTLLAQAFLHGSLSFLHPIGGAGQDPVFYHGKVFWSEGVFPSILLMPFVALFSLFNAFFYQGYLQWLLVLGVMWFVYKIAIHFKYTTEDSLIMAFAFCLSSVFIGVTSADASWYFAQVVTVFLLFWALYEYLTRDSKRWWLIGLICAFILLTRATATPILLFFVLEAWRRKQLFKNNIWLQLGLPVFIGLLLIGLYNYLRFNSPFQGGYAQQLLFPMSTASESQGLFALVHVPSNLYAFLLAAPDMVFASSKTWTLKFPYIKANIYGLSIFVTSPYFLYLFTQKLKAFDAQIRNLLIAAAASAALVLSYFGIGLVQYGYRYSLDFLPELFIVFLIIYRRNHTHISRGLKVLIVCSSLLNFYLLFPVLL